MAHEFETGFFGDMKEAWHGLGTVIADDRVKSAEALVLAGLDWEVVKQPNYRRNAAGEFVEIDREFEIVRTLDDRHLGSVGERYEPIQNVDAFSFGDNLVDSGEAKWHTAGSLRNGQLVWMLMKLPMEVKIAGMEDETIQPFVCINNSHDGSSGMSAIVTPVRVVCRNTQAYALRNAKRKFTVRHTRNAMDKVGEARRVLGIAFEYYANLEQIGNELVETSFSDSEFAAFRETLIPTKDKNGEQKTGRGLTVSKARQEMLTHITVNAPNLQNVTGTKWAALQAVIEMNDHYSTARKQVHDSAHVRMERIVGGGGMVQQAFDLLTA
jgi:phage/plasmid-like protein (TIGR03299 family)